MVSQAMTDIKALMMQGRRESGAGPAPTVEELRVAFDATMAGLPPVPGATVEAVDAGGVPAEWVLPETGPTGGVLLYLHGGGYMEGSPVTHRRLVTSLCLAGRMRGLSVDYRLAPEHPHPAAVEDALAAYRWLIGFGGAAPSEVVVAGDSAGGGLGAALLALLRDRGEPLPAGAYLLSPWTDLAATGASIRTRADVDPMLDPGGIDRTVGWYAGSRSRTDPLISPLYADLAGLPPMLIHVGDHEILLDDSVRLAERARTAGVEVELEVWPEAFHVFQMLVGMIPEADDAVERAGAWMAKRAAG